MGHPKAVLRHTVKRGLARHARGADVRGNPRCPFTTDSGRLDRVAVGHHRHQADDGGFGEIDLVDRLVRFVENLPGLQLRAAKLRRYARLDTLVDAGCRMRVRLRLVA